MVLDRQKAQTEARAEIERFLAEKQSRFEHEMCLARDRLLADNESELTRLDAKYSSKINSLDVRIESLVFQSSYHFTESNSTCQRFVTCVRTCLAASCWQKTCGNMYQYCWVFTSKPMTHMHIVC
jgi:hypothetical protein